MITLSFRTKLLLAMMTLVAGVSVITLLIVQNRVRQTYEGFFQYLFESQTQTFLRQREARLRPVKEWTARLAKNPRLLAIAREVASAASPAQEDVDNLYLAGGDQLNVFLLAAGVTRTNPASETLENPGVYFFLNNQGEVLVPGTNVLASELFRGLRRVARPMAEIGRAIVQKTEQPVGYLAYESEGVRPAIKEMMFTPILDEVDQHVHGVLVLGFSLPEERGRKQEISGIWLDGQFSSAAVPAPTLADLGAQLSQALQGQACASTNFTLALGGAPHRAYCQSLNVHAAFPPAYQVYVYSLSGAETEIRNTRLRIFTAGSLALVGALVVGLALSHGLSIPIREVVNGTTEIERGNYAVKVPVRSRDDVGRLAAAFNEMAEGLAQKERYRSVLNMVTDPRVAEELVGGKLALGGEVRQVSVLFCDIRGFTAMTQGMPPAEVIHLLNEHMTALTKVVYECDGVVDKFVGDLIMALFGAPKSTGKDALNAARCALRMLEERARLNRDGPRKIEIGIGIATGEAVAGCMGSSDRLNYTVLGERVNLASRLCSSAGRMEVVIDETTKSQLGDGSVLDPLPPLRLKGFSEAVPAFKLKGMVPHS